MVSGQVVLVGDIKKSRVQGHAKHTLLYLLSSFQLISRHAYNSISNREIVPNDSHFPAAIRSPRLKQISKLNTKSTLPLCSAPSVLPQLLPASDAPTPSPSLSSTKAYKICTTSPSLHPRIYTRYHISKIMYNVCIYIIYMYCIPPCLSLPQPL